LLSVVGVIQKNVELELSETNKKTESLRLLKPKKTNPNPSKNTKTKYIATATATASRT
jgi:hypothetical protein